MKKSRVFLLLFIIVAIVELFFLATQLLEYRFITKSLLMPILMLFLFFETQEQKTKLSKMVMFGLFFSFLGDFFLLRDKEEIFFLLGLGSFLICHVFYIIGFSEGGFFKNFNFVKALPFMIYGIGLYVFLFPYLGKFAPTVLVYALVISVMGIAAIIRKANRNSYLLILLGAIFFIFSDSIIAFDKFYQPFSWANFFIMLLYILAQISIVFGAIKQNEN